MLDGGGIDTVLALVSGEQALFSVSGVTLLKGSTSTTNRGGGLYVDTEGELIVTDCAFSENNADDGGGGAVNLKGGRGTFISNIFIFYTFGTTSCRYNGDDIFFHIHI